VAAGAAVAEAVPPGDTCGSGFFLGQPGLRLTGKPVEAHGLYCAGPSIRHPVLGFFLQSSAPPVELFLVCARALNELLCEAAEPSRTVSTAPLAFATVGVCFTDTEEFASSATPATSAAAPSREAAAHRELLLAPDAAAQSGQLQSPSGMAYKRRIDINLSQSSSS
jgi:hypothetical protein